MQKEIKMYKKPDIQKKIKRIAIMEVMKMMAESEPLKNQLTQMKEMY